MIDIGQASRDGFRRSPQHSHYPIRLKYELARCDRGECMMGLVAMANMVMYG